MTNLRYQESNAEILAKALELLEFIENHNSADNDSSFLDIFVQFFQIFPIIILSQKLKIWLMQPKFCSKN